MPKRICMVGYAHYPSDVRIRRETESLIRYGIQVDLICLKRPGQKVYERVGSVRVYRLPIRKDRTYKWFQYAFGYSVFFLLSALLLAVLSVSRRYDVVQFHTLPDYIIFAGALPKLLGAKLVLDMHEVMPEFYMTRFKVGHKHLVVKLLRVIERMSVRFADAVIVVTDSISRLVKERCKLIEPPVVIMNTVDENIFLPSARVANNKSRKKFVLMYHGALTSMYGVDLVIRAVNILRDKIPNVELFIVGKKAEAGYLEQIVKEMGLEKHVCFQDEVRQDDIPALIHQADVGVIPLRKDQFTDLSFSNKLAEFIVMRRPVVVTRLNSLLEYFPDDALVFFDSEDAQDLASCILDLYRNPTGALARVEQALVHYQRIKWSIMERRYIGLIASVAPREGRRGGLDHLP